MKVFHLNKLPRNFPVILPATLLPTLTEAGLIS